MPPNVAPTSKRGPANQPASRPNVQPRPSAASQTVGNRSTGEAKTAEHGRAHRGDQCYASRQAATDLGDRRQHDSHCQHVERAGMADATKKQPDNRAACEDCPSS